MRTKSHKGRYVAIAVFIVLGLAFYAVAGSVMDWLRVTMHGR